MAKPKAQPSAPAVTRPGQMTASKSSKSLPQLPAAELLSFLKGTRRSATWTEDDLAKALKIGLAAAKEAVAVLQLQGYIEPAGSTGKWRTSEQGELVSGAKSPRFTQQGVEAALVALTERIKAVNADSNAPYEITNAVASGDFLTDQSRVQAAEVGIQLRRKVGGQSPMSAKGHATELAFLKQLRGKTAVLRIHLYEDWMSVRSHRVIL